jgi:lactoylglutathione lyase
LFSHIDYVIIGVSDMAHSVKFYRDTLGLPLKYETKDWTEFASDKTTLALHSGPKASKEELGPGQIVAGKCSIGFVVPDIEESFKELQSKGVHFVMLPQQREGEGIKLAEFVDPDGLVISLSQAVERTEKTEIPAVSA